MRKASVYSTLFLPGYPISPSCGRRPDTGAKQMIYLADFLKAPQLKQLKTGTPHHSEQLLHKGCTSLHVRVHPCSFFSTYFCNDLMWSHATPENHSVISLLHWYESEILPGIPLP